MHCQVLNSINPIPKKKNVVYAYYEFWGNLAFEVFFNELISESSAGIAIQSNNAKDCNFFVKKKKKGNIWELIKIQELCLYCI